MTAMSIALFLVTCLAFWFGYDARRLRKQNAALTEDRFKVLNLVSLKASFPEKTTELEALDETLVKIRSEIALWKNSNEYKAAEAYAKFVTEQTELLKRLQEVIKNHTEIVCGLRHNPKNFEQRGL